MGRTVSGMVNLALRLLQLQHEYSSLVTDAALAAEFEQPGWAPRSQETIAEEYGQVLRELLR